MKYNLENPDEGIVDSFMQKHFLSAIFFPIGFVFCLTGYVIVTTSKDR